MDFDFGGDDNIDSSYLLDINRRKVILINVTAMVYIFGESDLTMSYLLCSS